MSVHSIKEQSLAEKKRRIDSNPCSAEQLKSLQCMEANGSDADKCEREVGNVRICKTFWFEIQNFRKYHRIEPLIPVPEERQQMKAIYLKTGSVKSVLEDMKKQYDL